MIKVITIFDIFLKQSIFPTHNIHAPPTSIFHLTPSTCNQCLHAIYALVSSALLPIIYLYLSYFISSFYTHRRCTVVGLSMHRREKKVSMREFLFYFIFLKSEGIENQVKPKGVGNREPNMRTKNENRVIKRQQQPPKRERKKERINATRPVILLPHKHQIRNFYSKHGKCDLFVIDYRKKNWINSETVG